MYTKTQLLPTQSFRLSEPMSSVVLVGSHNEHDLCPRSLLYCPTAHGIQTTEPLDTSA